MAFDFFSRRAALGFIVPEWLPTSENLQYRAAVAQLDDAVYSIIADRQRRLSDPQSQGKEAKVGNLQTPILIKYFRMANRLACDLDMMVVRPGQISNIA